MDIKILAGVQTDKDTEQLTTLQTLVATDCSVQPKYSQTNSQALGIGGSFVSDGWVSRAEVDGNITSELSISQLKLFMESCGFKTQNVSGKTKNLEFKINENGFDKYLTIVKDLYRDSTHDIAKSCLVSSIKLNATLQSYVKADVSLIGMDYTSNKTKLSATPTVVDEGTLICLGTTIKEENKDITASIENIDITIDRKLESKGALNSIYTKAIRPNAKGEVTLNLQFNEFDKDSYNKAQTMLKENTSYVVEVWFKDTKNANRIVKFKFPNVKISNVELTDLSGTGGIAKEMKAYPTATSDMPFELVIENFTV